MSTVKTTGAKGVQARGEVMGLLGGGGHRSGRGRGVVTLVETDMQVVVYS